jgi:hypothetical protein
MAAVLRYAANHPDYPGAGVCYDCLDRAAATGEPVEIEGYYAEIDPGTYPVWRFGCRHVSDATFAAHIEECWHGNEDGSDRCHFIDGYVPSTSATRLWPVPGLLPQATTKKEVSK